ncbi:MAG TPA: glycoside hydrolase family 3 N-terminal domain-containing protein [Solirubrobacterales bacterium]|nr:glycoside hydrolase family 3 N-terminal domain-containing protein [Solirubrobacterales bacterium]
MEGRLPPDDDELFEWTDSPARPPREEGTGEREPTTGERRRRRSDTEERRRIRPGTGERRAIRGDTGEFERSGRKPPPGRRARRRDLPARVRRRQDAIVGVLALAVLIGLIVLVTGGGGGGNPPTIGLKRLLGQTIVAKLGKGADQDLLRRIRQGQVGGLIAFPSNAQSLRADVQAAQAAAKRGGNPPLLVLIDQEGGDVKRLPEGPPDRSPQQLAAAGDEDASKDEGQKTGSYLKGLGVNVDLAPVLDVSQPNTDRSIASRTFGSNPDVVSTVGVAFAQGLQDGGVIATPKHFPGLGRATATTDERPVSVTGTAEDLESDLGPFQAAVDAGADMVMVSTASYPGLTPSSKDPASFSPSIVNGILRDRFGFNGVVITDDLESPGVQGSTGAIAAQALRAGDDLLLYARNPTGSDQAFKALVRQVKQGQLGRALVADAYERITSLKGNLP